MTDQERKIKGLAIGLGADLCGIATPERFAGAPEGHHPADIYPDCKSVIVFAKRVPGETLFIDNCIPYTHVNNVVLQEVDLLGVRLSLALEELGIRSVPVPSDVPYEHWEADRQYGRAILSMRHAGYLAGLGVLGKNTLLINEKYGNMIQVGAVLADAGLMPDEIATYEGCLKECHNCLDSCPQHALDGVTVDQKLCRPVSNYVSEKGFVLKKCNICRKVCPHCLGISP
jgi:epoxyqueuosine reductase